MTPAWPGPKRTIVLHDHGPDVRAWGRALVSALAAHGIKAVNARNGVYGRGLLLDATRFQQIAKLDPAHGWIGSRTQHALWPYVDAYGRLLLKMPIPKPDLTEVHRNGVLHFWEWVCLHSPIAYTQRRPGALTRAELLAWGGDCSIGFIEGYDDAGAPNPNGGPYNGYGNTGSLIVRGQKITTAAVRGAEGTFYGKSAGNTEHVQCELGPNNWRGPGWTVGHGSSVITPRPRTYRGDLIGIYDYPLAA